MQGEYRQLLVIEPIRRHLTALAIEDEAVGTVPVFHHIEPFVDLSSERLLMEIASQKRGFDGSSQFDECPVGRMLHMVAGEATQDRLRLRGA
jgi:hypothetical protein